MKLSSTQLAASALALAFTPSALAFDLTWQRYASGVLENAFYGGSYGFPIWAQGAEKVLIPLFKEIKTHQGQSFLCCACLLRRAGADHSHAQ